MVSGREELTRYPIDVEQAEEMNRLIKQAQLISEHVGLLPSQIQLGKGQIALDIGCGPGEWALEMARTHPDCTIRGLDISQHMLTYARACARLQNLPNAIFEFGDACQQLLFPDNSFDVVHARFVAGFLLNTTWLPFLKECLRVLRPGGFMCNIELDNLGITNSQAFTRYNNIIVEYIRMGQHCFTTEGPQTGILAVQARLLQEGGFADVRQNMHVLNFSLGASAHPLIVEDYSAVMKLMKPALLREKIISQEELDLVCTQTMADMHAEGFCGVAMFQTVWGRKPV